MTLTIILTVIDRLLAVIQITLEIDAKRIAHIMTKPQEEQTQFWKRHDSGLIVFQDLLLDLQTLCRKLRIRESNESSESDKSNEAKKAL